MLKRFIMIEAKLLVYPINQIQRAMMIKANETHFQIHHQFIDLGNKTPFEISIENSLKSSMTNNNLSLSKSILSN